MQKLARIAYNTSGWQRPTGDAPKYEGPRNYVRKYGFGHEEWLLRAEWLIGGWRYSFIQGVNKGHEKWVKANQPMDLLLFTIQPDKHRRFVANIRMVEILDNWQAEDALKVFKQQKWYDIMLEEVRAVGGQESAIGSPQWASHILNIRFRLDNVRHYPLDSVAPSDDPVIRLTRYQLYDDPVADKLNPALQRVQRVGTTELPDGRTYSRRVASQVECSPEHTRMQAQLMKELQAEYPSARLVREEDFVDVTVETPNELILFEIKSDLEPRSVIRHGLGQILEYAYHPVRSHKDLPMRLVIVGRRPPTEHDKEYMKRLQTDFRLPLEYRTLAIG